MVFGFTIISLSSEQITTPPNILSSLNQIIFSYFYSREGNDELKESRLEVIYKKIIDEYQFRKVAEIGLTSTRTPIKEGISLEWPNFSIGDSPKTPPKVNEEGIFKIPTGIETNKKGSYLFSTSKIVVWKQTGNVAYVLICEEEENRLLAIQFLNMLMKVVDDHFKKPGISASPREFLSKPEEFIILLQTFLPNGLLLFANTQLAKHLRKEAESLIVSK